jgi:hypothetical protein
LPSLRAAWGVEGRAQGCPGYRRGGWPIGMAGICIVW